MPFTISPLWGGDDTMDPRQLPHFTAPSMQQYIHQINAGDDAYADIHCSTTTYYNQRLNVFFLRFVYFHVFLTTFFSFALVKQLIKILMILKLEIAWKNIHQCSCQHQFNTNCLVSTMLLHSDSYTSLSSLTVQCYLIPAILASRRQ